MGTAKSFVKPRVEIKNTRIHGDSYIIYPDYLLTGKDIMMKGGKFYAVLDPDTNFWLTDKSEAFRIIDKKLYEYAEERFNKKINQYGEPEFFVQGEEEIPVHIRTLERDSNKTLHTFNAWMKELDENYNYHPLDPNLTFLGDAVKPEQYCSKTLPYKPTEGPIDAYEKLMSVLYLPEERQKLEWAIGSIIAGESPKIEKMIVIFGGPGSGKSTVLDLIDRLFEGYTGEFSASDLANKNSQFATSVFKDNPLVMIQDDGTLAKIDSPKINEIISHKKTIINEKNKALYSLVPRCMMFMATNDPVDIRDTNLGISRRLLDVQPTKETVPIVEYRRLNYKMLTEEIPAIAYHCQKVFESLGREYYLSYIPREMISRTNYIWNFIDERLDFFLENDPVKRDILYDAYKNYIESSNIPFPLNKVDFTNKMKEYYESYSGWNKGARVNGSVAKNVFSGFKLEKMHYEPSSKSEVIIPPWLKFDCTESDWDKTHSDCPAQYAVEDKDSGEWKPAKAWQYSKSKLKDLDTKIFHYVKPNEHEIILDFDFQHKIKDENKAFDKNYREALKWPETYAELSRSGTGIHLHYIYDGDIREIDNRINENVEIKKFPSDNLSALRRRLSKCNDIPIAHIDGALLPKKRKEAKVLNEQSYKTEKQLRYFIRDCINKKHHGATKPEIDFIKSELEKTYNSGEHYDVSDLFQDVMQFAAGSTNQSLKCLKIVDQMHFCSDDASTNLEAPDERPIVFFDIEVFPNLLLVNWKYQGADKKVVRMINPTASEVENLFRSYKMIGFNNRRYDNHILYARMQGYSLEGCYNLSQKIINDKSLNSLFAEAYNISYADVYDFANMDNKMSLKKWEIKLDIHHQELDLPWDQPVPEEMWNKVAEYCDNDVIATEAVFNACHGDWLARQILASISGLTVNDTTNKHTEKIIFGDAKHPQQEFNYVDLSKDFPGYSFDATRKPKSLYMGEDPGEGGYVYAEPGIYTDVALLDVASMHPSSLEAMNLLGVYTKNFSDLKQVRILIKHGEFDKAGEMFDGRLKPYLSNKDDAKALSNALKIAINSVYGLTSAKFDNKFKDPRNVDNIVAKRGALFMINLKHEVQKKGYTVAHIKTDSIKIPNADEKIINFVMEYGKKYGYTFEHEATYSKMCLVNDAVYIAQYADGEHEYELSTGEKVMTSWTATGAEFQHPYIFKTIFAKKPLTFRDYCETKTVQSGTMYLDMNEGLEDGQHNYHFVGRAGSFCPIKPGKNGGELMVLRGEKYSAVTKTKGWRWLEAEDVKLLNRQDDIDQLYFDQLNDDVIKHINEYGSFEEFVGSTLEPTDDFMNKPQ